MKKHQKQTRDNFVVTKHEMPFQSYYDSSERGVGIQFADHAELSFVVGLPCKVVLWNRGDITGFLYVSNPLEYAREKRS